MAANDRITLRTQVRAEAGISPTLASDIENLDASCGEQWVHIRHLCSAIGKIARLPHVDADEARHERELIAGLARQTAFWVDSLGNEVNCFAKRFGCNEVAQ